MHLSLDLHPLPLTAALDIYTISRPCFTLGVGPLLLMLGCSNLEGVYCTVYDSRRGFVFPPSLVRRMAELAPALAQREAEYEWDDTPPPASDEWDELDSLLATELAAQEATPQLSPSGRRYTYVMAAGDRQDT